MDHSFIAYIDESGDDGLDKSKFRVQGRDGGSSHWLVISALICRHTNDKNAVGWRNDILAKAQKKSPNLHFADLNHSQKLVAAQYMAQLPARATSVLSNKNTILEGTYGKPNQLYFYLTRYLIERISWFCRDRRRSVHQGDGSVQIVFSRRGGMSYPDFIAYLGHLKDDPTVQIHWPVIDIPGIQAVDHASRAGLQLADAIASGFACGLEEDRLSNCEPRYAEILKRITYHRQGNYLSYGVKLVPTLEGMALTEDQMRFCKLFK